MEKSSQFLSGIHQRLQQLGLLADEDLPVAQSLLLMAAAEREAFDLQPYEAQIVAMHDALTLVAAHPPLGEGASFHLDCLRKVIHDEYGYCGDSEAYEDPEHMNLISVMDRRRGIPVALGSLYLELARRQGWSVSGLNFPGHFLLRIEDGAQRIIFDPFDEGKVMQAQDLRQLLKKIMGDKAELHHHYYDAVTARHVVLRFCNNRKTRLIAREEYAAAMVIVANERLIAPNEPRLLFEAGMLSARLHQIQQAITYMEEFIVCSKDRKAVAEAQEVLRGFRRLLQ
mgnify:CR=1 FL=1